MRVEPTSRSSTRYMRSCAGAESTAAAKAWSIIETRVSRSLRRRFSAARRHGGKDVDVADYEMEVRRAGERDLIRTFVTL